MNGYKTDQQIMASYMRIGKGLVDNLPTMTIGEREGLAKELQGIEEVMACLGLKRIFEVATP